MATRQTTTHTGCHQLSNLRLCENRRCGQDNKKSHSHNRRLTQHNLASSQLHHYKRERQREPELKHHMQQEPAHRIRVSCECCKRCKLRPSDENFFANRRRDTNAEAYNVWGRRGFDLANAFPASFIDLNSVAAATEAASVVPQRCPQQYKWVFQI